MKNVKEMIPANGFVEGIDYEIVSILVESGESNFITLDEAFKVKSQVYFNELGFEKDIYESFAKHLKQNRIGYSLSRTRQPSYANCDTFYLLKEEVDFSSAYTFGFGVLKMIRGDYNGLYMLYNFNKVHDEGFEESDVIQELLALKMYLQYVATDEYYDEGVESLVKQNERFARALLTRDEDNVVQSFKNIFDEKKSEARVVVNSGQLLQ